MKIVIHFQICVTLHQSQWWTLIPLSTHSIEPPALSHLHDLSHAQAHHANHTCLTLISQHSRDFKRTHGAEQRSVLSSHSLVSDFCSAWFTLYADRLNFAWTLTLNSDHVTYCCLQCTLLVPDFELWSLIWIFYFFFACTMSLNKELNHILISLLCVKIWTVSSKLALAAWVYSYTVCSTFYTQRQIHICMKIHIFSWLPYLKAKYR